MRSMLFRFRGGATGYLGTVIATAETESEIRVISMRKADRHEQKIYFEYA